MNILCLFRFTFRRAAAAHLVAAAAALGLLAAAGCAFLGASLNPAGLLHPTLRAAWVPSVPLPNQRVETEVWGRAKPLIIDVVRRSGSVDDRVSVKLFAIHDGRALSILAMWADDRETFLRRDWLWKPEKHDYVLETNPVDEFMIEWPMRGSRDPCMLNGKESTWDVWQWFAGWTDIGGYAEDRTMEIKRRPPGTRPADVEGRLYPAIGGRGLVEIVWRDDEGVGGTTVNRKPTAYKEWVMPGAEARMARGSAADVQARGLYNNPVVGQRGDVFIITGNPEDQRRGFWFVEFHRLLVTASDRDDYEIRGRGPHLFAIALTNNAVGADHYTSGLINLVLDRAQD